MAGAAVDPAVQQLQEQANVARQQIGRMAESFDGLRAAHELLKTTSAQAESNRTVGTAEKRARAVGTVERQALDRRLSTSRAHRNRST